MTFHGYQFVISVPQYTQQIVLNYTHSLFHFSYVFTQWKIYKCRKTPGCDIAGEGTRRQEGFQIWPANGLEYDGLARMTRLPTSQKTHCVSITEASPVNATYGNPTPSTGFIPKITWNTYRYIRGARILATNHSRVPSVSCTIVILGTSNVDRDHRPCTVCTIPREVPRNNTEEQTLHCSVTSKLTVLGHSTGIFKNSNTWAPIRSPLVPVTFPALIIDLTLIRDVQILIIKDDLDLKFLFLEATVV